FRDAEALITQGEQISILGPNGSGKSTFLQIVAGALLPTQGKVAWFHSGKEIDAEEIYRLISFAAPYIDFPEELTLKEIVDFHFSFKRPVDDLSITELIAISGLSHASDRSLRFFSSGMRQRVRLLLALCSDVPLLLLDEPCSNLDKPSVIWYQDLCGRFVRNKTVLVASNQMEEEYFNCKRSLEITRWKS
ncbi:MAG: ATP-binding cassette domain-containing protein, partial [Bacteroidota bacterium]